MAGTELRNPAQLREQYENLAIGNGNADQQHADDQQIEYPVGHERGLKWLVDQGTNHHDHRQEQRHPEEGMLGIAH